MSDPILKRMFDLIYPVGSVYISVNNTNPAVLFGGTWVQIKDRFLLGAGTTYSNGTTGGEASHTLTTGELPKTSFRIPHVAAYDDCTVSGGGVETKWSYTNGKRRCNTKCLKFRVAYYEYR